MVGVLGCFKGLQTETAGFPVEFYSLISMTRYECRFARPVHNKVNVSQDNVFQIDSRFESAKLLSF